MTLNYFIMKRSDSVVITILIVIVFIFTVCIALHSCRSVNTDDGNAVGDLQLSVVSEKSQYFLNGYSCIICLQYDGYAHDFVMTSHGAIDHWPSCRYCHPELYPTNGTKETDVKPALQELQQMVISKTLKPLTE